MFEVFLMNSKDYVEACKIKIGCKSYYKLAKILNILESDLTFYKSGKRIASTYAAFKFAEILGIEPAIVLADIASEMEKNPMKKEFFKDFIARCGKTLAAVILRGSLFTGMSEGKVLIDC